MNGRSNWVTRVVGTSLLRYRITPVTLLAVARPSGCPSPWPGPRADQSFVQAQASQATSWSIIAIIQLVTQAHQPS